MYQIVSNVYRFGVLIELNLNKVHRRSVLADVGMHENAWIQYGGKLDLPPLEVSLLRKGKSWIFPSNRTATNKDHFLKDNHQLNRAFTVICRTLAAAKVPNDLR